MKDSRKNLNIFGNSLYILLIVVVITLSLFGFNYLNEKRKADITNLYLSETKHYIAENQNGLEIIFDVGFSSMSGTLKISDLISDDIKDYSSMMFIKETTPGKVEYLRLGNDRGALYVRNETLPEVIELLNGKKDVLSVDRYTYYFNSKEIIVPVKNSSGKVMGAIVRGVIEK